jgi:hypothetical protein
MQPVTTSNIQTQITSMLQKKPSGQNQKPVKTADNAPKGDTIKLPEDIVTLSISTQNSTTNKKPSSPVSNSEKEALLQDPSDKKNISIYV